MIGESGPSPAANTQDRIPLFEDVREDILHIHIPLNYNICNFKCSYCYLTNRKKTISDSTLLFLEKIIPRLEKIRRPVHVVFATDGEISAVPPLWPYLRRLSQLPSVVLVTLFSNLSGNFEKMLAGVDPTKLSIVASFHAEQLGMHSKRKENFYRTAKKLHEQVRKIVLSYILHPQNLQDMRQEMLKMLAAGIPVFAYPLVPIPVKGHPKIYSETEQQEVENILKKFNQSEAVNFFMMDGRKPGLKCSAGQHLVEIANDGAITACFKGIYDLGNILGPDDQAFLRTSDTLCPHGGCVCNWTVAFSDMVRAECLRVDSLYGFVKREAKDNFRPDFVVTE
jgi:MoaA/NifB/PqqE/SkfB family radical SAM enzyme